MTCVIIVVTDWWLASELFEVRTKYLETNIGLVKRLEIRYVSL